MKRALSRILAVGALTAVVLSVGGVISTPKPSTHQYMVHVCRDASGEALCSMGINFVDGRHVLIKNVDR